MTKETLSVLATRVDALQTDLGQITDSLKEINKALVQVIQLAVTSQQHDSAIARAHVRVDEISRVIHGGNGSVGVLSHVATLQESVRESIWFRRVVTAAIVTETIALMFVIVSR